MAKVVAYRGKENWQWNHATDHDGAEWCDRTEGLLRDLMRESDAAVVAGRDEGLLISFQVADGSAWYRVVSGKPLVVEHIPYGDAYQADPILLRGLQLDDIRVRAAQNLHIRQMFARRGR